jgi:hypothetical protein
VIRAAIFDLDGTVAIYQSPTYKNGGFKPPLLEA